MYVVPTIHPAYLLHQGKPIADPIRMDLAKAWRIANQGPSHKEQYCIVHPANPEGVETAVRKGLAWIARWRSLRCPVAADVETSSLNYFSCKLYSLALSGADDHATGVAFTLGNLHTLPADAERVMVQAAAELLADELVPNVFHNAPYDVPVLERKGLPVRGPIEDTMSLHHLVQPDIPHTLGWIGHTYLDVDAWKLGHKGEKLAFTNDVLELLVYNARDAIITALLRGRLLDDLEARVTPRRLIEYQMAFVRLASEMEIYGLPVNWEKRAAMGAAQQKALGVLLHQLRQQLNWPDFNPMNKNHAVKALYSKQYVGLTPTAWTEKTRQPSTRYADIIDHMEHPFVRDFIKYVERHHAWAIQYRDADPRGKTKAQRLGGAYWRARQEDGRIHVKWNPVGQKGSRFSSEPNCYDAATEVLTDQGWMFWPRAYFVRPRLAQYDPVTRQASFAQGTDFVRRSMLKGDWLVRIWGKRCDLRVTRDHRMLFERWRMNGPQRVERLESGVLPAEELTREHYPDLQLPTRADGYVDGVSAHSEAHVRLLCGWIAKGSFGGRHNHLPWRLYCGRTCGARLRAALVACGDAAVWEELDTRETGYYRNRGACEFVLHDCPVRTWIYAEAGGKKELGPWLLTWSTESLRVLAEEALHWPSIAPAPGGCRRDLRANHDWLQAATALSGARVANNEKFWQPTGARDAPRDFTNVRGLHTGLAQAPPPGNSSNATCGLELLYAPEKVYCATVPTGFLFVRRGTTVHICGNCQNQPKDDRAFFEVGEGRALVGADLDQLELRLAAVLAGVPELLSEMADPGGDPHRLAARIAYPGFDSRDAEEQKRLRDAVKNTVYASLYRAGVDTVYRTLRAKKFLSPEQRAALTRETVAHIYHSYFGKFVQIPIWHDRNYELAQTQGYNEIQPLGRRRYFPVQPPPYTEVGNWSIQTCLPESATLWTSTGLATAAEETPRVVLPSSAEAPAQRVARGSANLLRVTFADMRSPLLATSDHELQCQTAMGYAYKRVGSLRPGDLVCTPLAAPLDATRVAPQADMPYLLGLLVSDGATADYKYQLSVGTRKRSRPDVAQIAYGIAAEQGWDPRKPVSGKGPLQLVKLADSAPGRRKFRQSMSHWGYNRDWAGGKKRVPAGVLQGGQWTIRAFMSGLLDGDCTQGTTLGRTHRHPVYNLHMSSLPLLQQVQELAAWLGMPGKIVGPLHPGPKAAYVSWRLEWNAFDVEALLRPERLVQSRRRSRISQSCMAPPEACAHAIAALRPADLRSKSHRTVWNRMRCGGSTHPWTLREMYSSAGASVPLLYDAIAVERVEEATTDSVPVYTYRVAHPMHQYISGGLVSKNCGSDIVGMNMVHIQEELKRRYPTASIILHGHDAVYIECWARHAEAIRDLVDDLFGGTVLDGPAGSVRLTCKAKIGKNLLEVK